MLYSNFIRLALLLLVVASTLPGLLAQDAHTVRVGVFRDVKGQDFKEVQDLGYVYSLPAGEKEVEVYIGQFTDKAKATNVAAQLNQRGFTNTQLQTIPSNAGQSYIMIQFALHTVGRPIPWKTYDKLGSLHAQSIDGALKIFTGPYATTDVAKQALATLKTNGYQDAFVKSVSSLRLIPIDAFETGLKKPQFNIVLPAKTATAATPSSPQGEAPLATSTNDTGREVQEVPATYGTPVATPGAVVKPTPASAPPPPVVIIPPAAAAPSTLPAATGDAVLPTFDGSQKRHSTAELQTILKQKGYYSGSIDGLYGPGTRAGYEKAWNDMPEVRKYRLLSGASFAPVDAGRGAVTQWPEVAVLLSVVEDLAAGQTDVERQRTMVGQRAGLMATKEKLNPVAASRMKTWETTLWENLTGWAEEDPLHQQIIEALRVSYFQSQSRLEQHFSNAGFGPIEARDLSTAMMQNLTGAQLSRFL